MTSATSAGMTASGSAEAADTVLSTPGLAPASGAPMSVSDKKQRGVMEGESGSDMGFDAQSVSSGAVPGGEAQQAGRKKQRSSGQSEKERKSQKKAEAEIKLAEEAAAKKKAEEFKFN